MIRKTIYLACIFLIAPHLLAIQVSLATAQQPVASAIQEVPKAGSSDTAEVDTEYAAMLRRVNIARQQLSAERTLLDQRLALLKQRMQLAKKRIQVRKQIELIDTNTDQQVVELEQQLDLIDMGSERTSIEIELIEKRAEVLELEKAFNEEDIKVDSKFSQKLHDTLTEADELIHQFFSSIAKGDDRLTEKIEVELGVLEHTYEIEKEILQLKFELHFAELNEEKEFKEELEFEIRLLKQELDTNGNLSESEFFESEEKLTNLPKPLTVDEGTTLSARSWNFDQHIAPILKRYCYECHSTGSASGDLDLLTLAKAEPLVRNRKMWQNISQQIRLRSMPPSESDAMPDSERLIVAAYLKHEIDHFDYKSVRQPGYEPARRLTNEEYNHTIRDLFGIDLRPADRFPRELTASSGFANSANSLFLQPVILERYLGAAEQVIQTAMPQRAETKELQQIRERLVGSLSAVDAITQFARRAFRRPVVKEELLPLLNYYTELSGDRVESVANEDISYQTLGQVFQAILASPSFLFRSENSQNMQEGQPVAISDHELASRLSYFLWASMPDAQLTQAADDSTLSDPNVLHAQVKRMLADPKSKTLGEIFAAQWLGFSALPHVPRDPIDNPWATDSLVDAMQKESALFFWSLVDEDQPIDRLLDANYTFVNEELAKHYDLDSVDGPEMRRVSLKRSPRSGILGQGSILAVTSFPGRTSPVVRGNWILSELLGTPPPPPPPNVSEFNERVAERHQLTQRQKLELHRSQPNCYTCHSQIDPLGFALEQYDWFGRFRDAPDDRKLDIRGNLPEGKEFRGLNGLQSALLSERRDHLVQQITRKMMSYALGRQLEYFDESVIQEIIEKVESENRTLQALIHAIVESDTFQMKQLVRRAEK